MNNILLINLKKFGDIFQSAHLITSIKNLNPHVKIDVLCFEESARAAKTILNINNLYTINRKKIISFYKNNIYSDGLAFNQIHQDLESVLKNQYDKVINYSNDRVTSYLTSYITNKLDADYYGVKFDSRNNINHSNSFAIILNDVMTTTSYTPFHFNDSYHYLCGLQSEHSRQCKIKNNPSHDETAKTNFNKLKSLKADTQGNSFIVGIQTSTASTTKNIPESVLIETIKLLSSSSNIIPILLNAPNEQERLFIKKINSNFNNKVVSVEADFIALPSVLKGIDLLLTPDTSVKHVADLVGTPCLEVSLGESPFLKQGTVNPQSAIISRPANLRIFKEGIEDIDQVLKKNEELSPFLIYHTITALLSLDSDLNIPCDTSSNYCVYKPVPIQTGVIYSPISGPYSSDFEIRRLISRAITLRLAEPENVSDSTFKEVYQHIYHLFSRQMVVKVINEEKKALSDLTRDLLSALRGLIQTQEDKRKAPQFIEGLEKLISHSFDKSLAGIPTIYFRAKIDSLNTTSLDENLKQVESLLYIFKGNIQYCFNILKELEKCEIKPTQILDNEVNI